MFKKLVGLLTVVVVGLFLSGVASAQILGSAHDFSGASWNSGANTGEICAVCHTPHNAINTTAAAPLWDRTVSTETFLMYTSSSNTLDAVLDAQPTGVSLLCLSCHDGSIALDSFGGQAGSVNITGSALVGTDLRDDHPISFTYDAALATLDGGLFDPSTITSIGGTITNDLLFGGSLECGSCHDVHDSAKNAFLLTIDNTGSALCSTCHDK